LVGGGGGDADGTFDDFYDYTDGNPGSDSSSLPVKVISSEAGGRVFNVSVPLIVGDGSTATAFTSTAVVTVVFRQNSDIQANYPPLCVLPNIIGLRVDAATGDLVTINNHAFQSVSPWYLKFEGTPTAGIDFQNNTVLGAGRIDVVDDVDLTGCVFNDSGAVTAGSATIDECVFRNIRDAYFLILDDVVDLSDLTFVGSSAKADLTGLGTSNIDATNDIVTVSSHGYPRGSVQMVTYDNGGGSDLAGLTDGADYWIYIQNDDDFQVYDSYDNAKTQTSARTLTTAGSGTAHSFSPAAHAIMIETAGTYNFDGLTFTGFGADGTETAAIYNNSGGSVTINVTNGSAPTVRNSSGSSTTVQVLAPVVITAVESDGTPIEDARVYLETTPGGVEIFDGSDGTSLTDSNGEVSIDFTGTTPVNVTGRVRKSTTSPFYKTGVISGQVTSSGFSATVVMVLDE